MDSRTSALTNNSLGGADTDTHLFVLGPIKDRQATVTPTYSGSRRWIDCQVGYPGLIANFFKAYDSINKPWTLYMHILLIFKNITTTNTMAAPITYSFYGTTIPVLKNLASSAISILTTAKNERANDVAGKLPSEEEILNSNLGDMLPFRLQPILLAKFSVVALEQHQLNGTTAFPALSPAFTSLDDVIDFFKTLRAAYDAIEEKAYNDSAEKSASVPFANMDLTLHMSGLADYFHSFVVPNSYFHLNVMYMVLRSKGFKLGKDAYIEPWMSEQQYKDWEPLRAVKK